MRFWSILTVGVIGILFGAASSYGQAAPTSSDGLWQVVTRMTNANDPSGPWSGVKSYQLVSLEQAGLQNLLKTAPAESGGRVMYSTAEITLPMPDGSFQRFRFVESPVMAPELGAKYPDIRTFLGQGIDDPHATVRFDWTPLGFHALVLSPSGSAIVDPYIKGQTDLYVSFYRRDVSRESAAWTCLTNDKMGVPDTPYGVAPLGFSSGSQLRTYRVAFAATGEYTQQQGGVAQAIAAITTVVNRLTGVYEQEFCIRLQLIANNNLIVYTNGATDPYTNGNNSAMLSENQTNL